MKVGGGLCTTAEKAFVMETTGDSMCILLWRRRLVWAPVGGVLQVPLLVRQIYKIIVGFYVQA